MWRGSELIETIERDPSSGRAQVRFSFPKKIETIERGLEASRRLRIDR
jgi:hypothetical protein